MGWKLGELDWPKDGGVKRDWDQGEREVVCCQDRSGYRFHFFSMLRWLEYFSWVCVSNS